MASKTDDAILAMLTVAPMSGYDMKRFSEQSLTHFWHESFGNLYPRLRRLEADGLVRSRQEARSQAPDATVYSLTEAGRDRFEAWLEEEAEPETVRNELLLKIFFGARGKLETCRRRIEAHRREQEALLARYGEIGTLADDEGEGRPEGPFWRISLRRGVLLTEARIRWCDECLEMLTDLIEKE